MVQRHEFVDGVQAQAFAGLRLAIPGVEESLAYLEEIGVAGRAAE
jgi:hypothetical protein